VAVIEEPSPSSVTIDAPVPPVPSADAIWQLEVQDECCARRVPLGAERLVVGSAEGADIVIHDATVSARHCALALLGSGVAIEDLGSKNGTYVGLARVREAWGQAGTVVTVGRSTLLMIAVDGAESADVLGEPLEGVAGASVQMRRVAAQVRRLAAHSLPVLVVGESGTGKELIARALHREGPRRARPFVALNVTALPRELVESELFGHERGAFTGAHVRREGAFAEAEGGTLFLDEIGDLPMEAQPKLLRALDGYEIRRVGGAGSGRRADVRVVAATHARLEQRVAQGDFRRDLFHRLECLVVRIPALRERRGDIAAIASELLDQLKPVVGPRHLSPAAIARLAAHDWPGNVRELRNVLCRAADASMAGVRIDAAHVERAMRREPAALAKCVTHERAREIFRQSAGNLSAAARAAGMPRTSFRKLLRA
jgi:two-component system, NtrC family, response regulator GlrR